jgi:hypothetical protein
VNDAEELLKKFVALTDPGKFLDWSELKRVRNQAENLIRPKVEITDWCGQTWNLSLDEEGDIGFTREGFLEGDLYFERASLVDALDQLGVIE